MKKLTLLLSFILAVGITANAQIIVNPISATTSLTPAYNTSILFATNGNGLDSFPSLTANHYPTVPLNSVVYAGTAGSIDFNLGNAYLINGLSFWNQNNGGPSTTIGIDSVNFFASTDGINYTIIRGAPTNFLEVLVDTAAPEIFTFPNVGATHIRMQVFSVHGSPVNLGFAEIAFSASQLVGLNENDAALDLKIFPNPAQDYIKLEGLKQKSEYVIYDIKGQLMLRGNTSEGDVLDVSALTSGMYFVQIEEGRLFKFVVE